MSELQTWEQTVKLRQKKKIIMIVSAISVCMLLMLGFFKSAQYMRTSDFCDNCHKMKPYHTTWKQSSHSGTACADCHFPVKKIEKIQGLKVTDKKYWSLDFGSKKINVSKQMNVFKSWVGKVNENYTAAVFEMKSLYYKSGTVKQFLVMMTGGRDNSEKITWQSCDTCHGKVDSAAAKTDDVGHSRHEAIGMQCKDCHGDLTHEGTKEMTTKDCKSCHADQFFWPASHKNSDFEKTHGQKFKKAQRCLLCHTKGAKEELCMNCHGIEMPHPENFTQYHVQAIKQITIEKCTTCHEDIVTVKAPTKADNNPYLVVGNMPAPPTKKKTGNAASCSRCHGKDMPHQGGAQIVNTHGKLAKDRGIATCLNCHAQKTCTDCHGTNMPHAKNFLRQHTNELKKIGLDKCLKCHDVKKKNICSDCHKVTMPHPDGWRTNHGKDTKTCKNCHSPKNPTNPKAPWAKTNFCEKCHSIRNHAEDHYNLDAKCTNCHEQNLCSRCHNEVEVGGFS